MLKGESFHPCAAKIGPRRKGRHFTSTPAARAVSSTRAAAGYEYVLANSNQNCTVRWLILTSRLEDEVYGTDQAKPCPDKVHSHRLSHEENRERHEHRQRHDFLHDLELIQRQGA